LLRLKAASCLGVRPVVAIAGGVEGVERQNELDSRRLCMGNEAVRV
jgi:hypothetical protein